MSMYDMLTELMIKRGEDEDAVMEMLKQQLEHAQNWQMQ